MAQNAAVNNAANRASFVKKRIAKARSRARNTGFWYLIATIALFVLTCLSLVTLTYNTIGGSETTQIGVMTFVGGVEAFKAGQKSGEWVILFAIYGVLILILLINVLRTLGKLKWLFTKKASRLYGVNRNAYAMDDLGRIFSGSFASIIAFHFAYIMIPTVSVQFNMFAYVAFGVGIFFHFACGISAGKVSLFSTNGNTFAEEKREVGLFLPFVRNIFQIAAVAGILFILTQSNIFSSAFTAFMNVGNANISKAGVGVFWQELLVALWAAIIPLLCAILLLITAIMLWRALDGVEFDVEGPDAPGKKKFLVSSIVMVLVVAAIYLVQMYVQKEAALPQDFLTKILYIGGIALAMVLIELIFRSRVKKEVVVDGDEVDITVYATKYGPQYVPVQTANGVQMCAVENTYDYGSYFDGVQANPTTKKQKKADRKALKEKDEIETDRYIYGQYKAAGDKAAEQMRKVEEYRAKTNPKNKKRK